MTKKGWYTAMKKFLNEFKAFAVKGNAMDLAVGMMIGAAFTSIVNSLVNNLISPLIGLLVKVDFSDLVVTIQGVDVQYGAFIMAVINFIIVALVLFLLVKAMNALKSIGKKPEEDVAPAAPTTKVCPFCKSEIAIDATRCPHCTSELGE